MQGLRKRSDIKRINVDPRGKISCGYKKHTTDKNGKPTEYPVKVDHFLLVNPETQECNFPELVSIYGDKPQMFIVKFPSDTIEHFYSNRYKKWGTGELKTRDCNGDECEVYFDTTIAGETYKAGATYPCICNQHNMLEDDKQKANRCSINIELKCYIMMQIETDSGKEFVPINPQCYLIKSTSVNSDLNIISTLENFTTPSKMLFQLSAKMVSNGKNKFVVLNLHPYIDPTKLMDYNMRLQAGEGLKQIQGSAPMQQLNAAQVVIPAEEVKEMNKGVSEYEFDRIVSNIRDCMSFDALSTLLAECKLITGFTEAQKLTLNDEYKTIHNFLTSEAKKQKEENRITGV